jgi:feruloyl esterase
MPSPPLNSSTYTTKELQDFNTTCNNLVQNLNIPNAQIKSATVVEKGVHLKFPGVAKSCTLTLLGTTVSSNICRVVANVSTSDRSGVLMEAWLPLNWTGRFLGTGNGGLNGCKLARTLVG